MLVILQKNNVSGLVEHEADDPVTKINLTARSIRYFIHQREYLDRKNTKLQKCNFFLEIRKMGKSFYCT